MAAASIIYYFLVGSALVYFIVIIGITVGWFRLKKFNGRPTNFKLAVSIVVAVRNEEANILKLLNCLIQQDYPTSNFEVIVVNDHSEDDTFRIVEDLIKVNPAGNIKLIHASDEGKKNALAEAYNFANGELILTTDGDCEMGPKWISRMVAYYQTANPKLVIAPVSYHNEKGFLQKFYSLDFISLVASGAGSAGINKPIMGNGANLAFEKECVASFQSDESDQYASGDDVFLIQNLVKSNGAESVKFIKDSQTMVYTNPPSSLRDFFRQRIRWASKAKAYKSTWAVLVSLAVFMFNTMLVVTLISGFFQAWMFVIFGLFIVFKLLVDLPLLYEFTGFANKRKLMFFFPVFELIYPFYIVISAIIGLFFRYEWKGRTKLR